jgi:hypothetical protein
MRVHRPRDAGAPAASRTVEQPFGILGHLPFLEVVQELGGMVALGLADRFENARLGDAAEVVVDRRPPARRYIDPEGHLAVQRGYVRLEDEPKIF